MCERRPKAGANRCDRIKRFAMLRNIRLAFKRQQPQNLFKKMSCCHLTAIANQILRKVVKRLIQLQWYALAFAHTFIITIPRVANNKDTHLRLTDQHFATLGEKSSSWYVYVGHLGIGIQVTVMPKKTCLIQKVRVALTVEEFLSD